MATKKPQMFCQWCDPDKVDTIYHGTYHGNVLHVGKKHPKHSEDLKKNKELYLKMFACDSAGNPIEPEVPEPPVTPPPDPPTDPPTPPAQEVTPPVKKEKPAEDRGFLDTLKKAIAGLPG